MTESVKRETASWPSGEYNIIWASGVFSNSATTRNFNDVYWLFLNKLERWACWMIPNVFTPHVHEISFMSLVGQDAIMASSIDSIRPSSPGPYETCVFPASNFEVTNALVSKRGLLRHKNPVWRAEASQGTLEPIPASLPLQASQVLRQAYNPFCKFQGGETCWISSFDVGYGEAVNLQLRQFLYNSI